MERGVKILGINSNSEDSISFYQYFCGFADVYIVAIKLSRTAMFWFRHLILLVNTFNGRKFKILEEKTLQF